MVNATDDFVTDFKKCKTTSTEKIDQIERLLLEDVMENETVKIKDVKQQIEMLQIENNRLN